MGGQEAHAAPASTEAGSHTATTATSSPSTGGALPTPIATKAAAGSVSGRGVAVTDPPPHCHRQGCSGGGR